SRPDRAVLADDPERMDAPASRRSDLTPPQAERPRHAARILRFRGPPICDIGLQACTAFRSGILYSSMSSRDLAPVRAVPTSTTSQSAAGSAGGGGPTRTAAPARLELAPLDTPDSLKNRAYSALKGVITAMDVYRGREDIRLDERQLAEDLGISRTPVREALAQLEREGFVRSVPRRGVYVVRKTKREVIELITAWAA